MDPESRPIHYGLCVGGAITSLLRDPHFATAMSAKRSRTLSVLLLATVREPIGKLSANGELLEFSISASSEFPFS